MYSTQTQPEVSKSEWKIFQETNKDQFSNVSTQVSQPLLNQGNLNPQNIPLQNKSHFSYENPLIQTSQSQNFQNQNI